MCLTELCVSPNCEEIKASTLRTDFRIRSMLAITVVAALVACGSADFAGSGASPEVPAASEIQNEPDRGVFPPTPTVVPLFADPAPRIQPDLHLTGKAELVGIVDWINSPPLELDLTGGKPGTLDGAVLIDFWTYTCVNCIRTFPFLRALHERYADEGLTIIGVHSPEFDFERLPENVRAAVERHDLRYPIAIDSDKATWDSFGNLFWPSTYLFDSSGDLVYKHFGEGGYVETEMAVRDALEASGLDLGDVEPLDDPGVARAADSFAVTREIYTGYAKVYELGGVFAAQGLYYEEADATAQYEDKGLRRDGQFELQGLWRNESNGIVHGRATTSSDDYIVFQFFGTSVNAVISPNGAGKTFEVELDGRPILVVDAGTDVSFEESGDSLGKSLIVLEEARMYRLVELAEFGRHELKLRTADADVKIHNFTFGIYETGP